MEELSVRIAQTTRAFDELSAAWSEGSVVLQIHDLPHTILHRISGHQWPIQRDEEPHGWFLSLYVNSAGGGHVNLFGDVDPSCETCVQLIEQERQRRVARAPSGALP